MVLKNNCRFHKYSNTSYVKYFAQTGLKNGDTINIRKPPRYSVTSGATIGLQDSTETSTSLQVSQYNIGLPFTSAELTLSIDDYSKRFITPAMAALANDIDKRGLQTLAQATYHSVGTPGTTPTSLKTYAQARAKVLHAGAPVDGNLACFIGPDEEVEVVNDTRALFHKSSELEKQYAMGQMGSAIGMDWVMDQNVYRYTTGALGGTPLVNGAVSSGSSVVTDGWTASVTGVVKKGDVLTFSTVFAVNPQNRVSTGQLQQFVVTADADSDGSGNATISVSPAIVTSGNTQNVTNAIPDNATILIFGHASSYAAKSTSNNLVFHRDAICFASVDMMLPTAGAESSRATDPDSGLTMRLVHQFDITNDRDIARLDVLYGWVAAYPELAARVQG